MIKEIIKRNLIVPVCSKEGNSLHLVEYLDGLLMSEGFKLSKNLFDHLSLSESSEVEIRTKEIVAAVKELIGSIEHNVYFINFPEKIPDTKTFWMEQLIKLIFTGNYEYGKYQHTYEEMVTKHEDFIASSNYKIINLGGFVEEEYIKLYKSLAYSNVPLNEKERDFLQNLAFIYLNEELDNIPVRENKAIINAIKIKNNKPILADTVTDILRLACQLSDGDVTLETVTKFKSFKRSIRKALLQSLEIIISKNPLKLEDVYQYKNRWKRLGEYLHPGEYKFKNAYDVFAIARDDKKVLTFNGRVELAYKNNNAMDLLSQKPGLFIRNIDRLARTQDDLDKLTKLFEKALLKVSGRVLLSLKQHFLNRSNNKVINISENTYSDQVIKAIEKYNKDLILKNRIFINKQGKSFIKKDDRKNISENLLINLMTLLNKELDKRILDVATIDKRILDVAVPLSNKTKASGFGVYPRGSSYDIKTEILRFFIYWKEKQNKTDFDLSAICLDEDFNKIMQISYTNLKGSGATHSGDLTSAPNGASEFIDLELTKLNPKIKYIIPLVYVYEGESFEQVNESYFGFMFRKKDNGKPYEPSTVQNKSDIRGKGKIAMPIIFKKEENWKALWIHLYMKGYPDFNRTENSINVIKETVANIVNKKYIKMDSLFNKSNEDIKKAKIYIGLTIPENLLKDCKTYTLNNFHEFIPE